MPGDSTGSRLVAVGEIDMATASQLAAAIDSLIDAGVKCVTLDAKRVAFLDSSGLRVIINSGNRLSTAGGELFIDEMSGAVRRVLEVSGLLEKYRSTNVAA